MTTIRFERPSKAPDAVDRVVYRNEQEFNNQPFLGGLWRTRSGDLVLAFMSAECSYESAEAVSHNTVMVKRRLMRTIRSADNGRTWGTGNLGTIYETPEPETQPGETGTAEEPLPLEHHADILVAVGATPTLLVRESQPWMRISTDGGHTWRRPFKLPPAKLASVSGHGSFLRRSDGLWMVGLTAASADIWHRRPVLYGSWDGADWQFLSFVTPPTFEDEVDEPREAAIPRFSAHRYMYPRPIQLRDGRILCSVRCQRDPTAAMWTEVFESRDGGRTFRFLSRVNDWGAPGDIIEMRDGRIACVYGYRIPPYGVRCRLSSDGGATWGRETILRDDGGSWDLGYPRVIEIDDGRLLAVYAFNRADDPIQMDGGVRHIASTEFTPLE